MVSTDCISPSLSPKTYIVIKANPVLTGWELLTKILKARVVSCGALPDDDIDTTRTSIIWNHKESIHDFYARNQQLITQYEYRYGSRQSVPIVKILHRFITELNRCHDFVPYIVPYNRDITIHLRSFSDLHHQDKLSFDLDDVYHTIVQSGLPSTPSHLRPSIFHQSTALQSIQPSSVLPSTPVIASCDYDPTIMAFSSHKRRCQVFLMGFHQENDCYL